MLNTSTRRLSTTCACCIRPLTANAVSRRQVLAGAAAGVATAAVASFPTKSSAQTTPRRIDVHHHLASPSWLQAMKLISADDPVIASWSVQKSLDDMDKGGVATAVLSGNVPQVRPLGREVATRIARECNEYAKQLATGHPGRFGLFAMLPLPYIDESLKEIAYALDTLKADGVGILTNYGDKWLGYSYFDPIWDELNRRKATVYTHPADASCCINLVQGVPEPILEWGGRHDAQHHQPDFQRHVAEIPRYQLDLLARRRRADRLCRTASGANGYDTALPGQIHSRHGSGRTESLPLRHRASVIGWNVGGPRQAGSDIPDHVRHRLSVSHGCRAF
jgi:Amidohydrolase